jgi:hypothetical protein
MNQNQQMTGITPCLSIITLHGNVLNSVIKTHRVMGWIKKQYPTTCCLQETHFPVKDKHKFKVKE